MSDLINVCLAAATGAKYVVQLKKNFTIDDIKKKIVEKIGEGDYQLIINGKPIQDNDPAKFAEIRGSIQNNSTIYVLQRMKGGSKLVDLDSHKATILVDLQDELRKVPVQNTLSECMICYEEKQCIKYCCSTIVCKECFPNQFVCSNYNIKCLTCDKIVPMEEVFVSEPFIRSLKQLDETAVMARNIDFQICTCGALSINTTMYAKQKCNNCQRWLCFFCNADWDEQGKKMRNEKYTCRVNCFWETKITYQLVQLEYNKEMEVPNRRCCPKCFECGSYDLKCKYHTCRCGHKFCFICLEAESECKRLYKSNYDRPCSNVAQQTFQIFPRLCQN